METNKIAVLRMKTLIPLFVITTSAGILCLIMYQFYITTSPRQQFFKESMLNISYIDSKEKVQSINMKNADTNLTQVINNIFNITREIEEIKEKLRYFDKGLKTINEDVDIALKHSNNVTTESKSLLTIFSTWKKSEDRYNIFNNTLKNWASFKPVFNPVLFTNDTDLAKDARLYGWTVLPLIQLAENGLPILKYMYIDVITEFRSTFYCYANSDILFEDGLVKTLVNLEYALSTDFLEFKPVFITGLRWNVVNVLGDEISPRDNLKTLIAKRGQVFLTSAEDYFITNRIYPWQEIEKVVVGSVAYDNWLVANAREKKHLTINASRTVPALHQSVDKNNHRSHMRDTANYNANLLKNVYNINIPYHKGFLECIEKFTDFVNDTFVLGDRMVNQYCN